jgi:hypothetical protein
MIDSIFKLLVNVALVIGVAFLFFYGVHIFMTYLLIGG